MTDLIIAVDDKLEDAEAARLSPEEKRLRLHYLVEGACIDFADLRSPLTGSPVQLKLNSVARSLGTECFDMVRDAGLELMLDWKLGPDVLDTMWADIRGIMDYEHIRRFTFRVECPVEFLSGRDGKMGASAMMSFTSFLPVGPVTDLPDEYYRVRMGLQGGRPEAMKNFGNEVLCFGKHVTEIICGPKDIGSFSEDFLISHNPVTPAVRPAGLKGNEANNLNAFNVMKAMQAGSSALIVGSSIMSAENRREAAELVIMQMADAHAKIAEPLY